MRKKKTATEKPGDAPKAAASSGTGRVSPPMKKTMTVGKAVPLIKVKLTQNGGSKDPIGKKVEAEVAKPKIGSLQMTDPVPMSPTVQKVACACDKHGRCDVHCDEA